MRPEIEVCAAMIYKDGKILISQRPKGDRYEGKWEFPGGKREEGEDLKQCIEREIREELGLKIETEEILFETLYEMRERKIRIYLLRCKLKGMVKKKDPSFHLYRWVTLKEAEKYDLLPPDREFIRKLRQIDLN